MLELALARLSFFLSFFLPLFLRGSTVLEEPSSSPYVRFRKIFFSTVGKTPWMRGLPARRTSNVYAIVLLTLMMTGNYKVQKQ